MLQQRTHRMVALVAAAVLVVGAVVVGALLLARSQTTGGAATTASPTRPVPSPGPSSSGSSSPGTSSPLTATATSAPGANALALAGTGPGRGQFTPATGTFSLHTTYGCPAGAPAFRLVITGPAGATVVTIEGSTSGDERRTVTGAGVYTLEVSGGCSWTVEATG